MKWVKSFIQDKIDQYHDWQNPDREENPMSCPEVVVDGIDLDLYEKLQAEAIAAGAVFDGSKVTLKGCEFLWAYDGISRIRYTCTSKPFYFSCKLIQTQIEDLVQKSKEAI